MNFFSYIRNRALNRALDQFLSEKRTVKLPNTQKIGSILVILDESDKKIIKNIESSTKSLFGTSRCGFLILCSQMSDNILQSDLYNEITPKDFGFMNVLLSERDYSLMEAQLFKSSAGAYDLLNIRVTSDALEDIKNYKNNGYHLYGLYRGENSKDIFEEGFEHKALIMLGGEKRGIRSDLLELCDDYLYIPYGSDFRKSLNACGALDVTATLLFQQRKK